MIKEKLEQAVWILRTLFQLGKTSGSTGNISFREEDKIYISQSGTCFGTMTSENFSIMDIEGNLLNGKKPSKEFPLHLSCYKRYPDVHAVIHTHGRFGVLWSCIPDLDTLNCIPDNTPYLKMKLGKIHLVPYEQPGTPELFAAFENCMGEEKGYLLKQHGALVCGKNLMDAFYGIEELEESACIAWNLYQKEISV